MFNPVVNWFFLNCVSTKLSVDKIVTRPNCQLTHLSVDPFVSWPICQLTHLLSVDQIVSWPNCQLTKLSVDQIVSRPNCHLTKLSVDQVVSQPNCQLTKLSVDQIVSQPNCQLTKLSVNQIVSRPNCQSTKLSVGQIVFDQRTWKPEKVQFFLKSCRPLQIFARNNVFNYCFFCKTKSEWKVWILQWCIFKWINLRFFRQKNFYFLCSPFETLFTPPFNTL